VKSPLLEVRGLEVDFDGFRAVDGLDLSVSEGELRFLIGPNGAGKTTLIDTITGLTRPTAGSVRFAGEELAGRRPFEIVRLGVGRTFQTPSVFEQLTVVENIDLALGFRRPFRSLLRRRRGIEPEVAEALETVGLTAQAERPAGILSHGQKQWLEIAMLLVQRPRLLLLDEPVAGMSDEETERTAELFVSLAGDHSLVVVEHDMAFIASIARKVTVLHEGSVLAEGPLDAVQNDPRVIEVYLGR
jgi:urea transport system ATP-binding protein